MRSFPVSSLTRLAPTGCSDKSTAAAATTTLYLCEDAVSLFRLDFFANVVPANFAFSIDAARKEGAGGIAVAKND